MKRFFVLLAIFEISAICAFCAAIRWDWDDSWDGKDVDFHAYFKPNIDSPRWLHIGQALHTSPNQVTNVIFFNSNIMRFPRGFFCVTASNWVGESNDITK